MNLCINPDCNKPQNLDTNRFCANCGSELLLAGNYKVIKQQDCNASCHTYEVYEVASNITKILKSTSHDSLQKTAEVLQQLNHPGIPKVDKNGYFIYFPRKQTSPLYCLVMEKIEGVNLLEYLAKQDNQPIDEILSLKWLRETIDILQQIHSHNLLHLHINPTNILVKPDGNLAIIGFGNLHSSENIAYIPPEQINDSPVPQSDFFALGRVFAFLLTGKEAASNIDIYESDLSNKLGSQLNNISWRNYTQQISPQLTDLLDAMMASAPIQRPADTEEILRRLANLNPSINAPSIPNPVAISKQINSIFLIYWVLATITGGSIGGLIGYLMGISISFIVSAAVKNIVIGLASGGAIFGVLIGVLIGVLQALVMRQSGFLVKRWGVVTALGFTIEGVVGIFAGNYGDNNFIFVPGIVVGILQWLLLRNQVFSAFWWVVASISGGVVAVVINKAVIYFLGNAYTVFGCILGLIAFGIITGVALGKLYESPKYQLR